MSQHKTNRGREFNMQAFADAKGESVAVGNSNRNARGDLLGPGGKVIATRQQITSELYNQRSAKPNTTTVKLNPMEQEISRKDIVGADGIPRWEITYADGSVEIQDKLETKIETRVDIDRRVNNTGDF
jgi:hypothetical protein